MKKWWRGLPRGLRNRVEEFFGFLIFFCLMLTFVMGLFFPFYFLSGLQNSEILEKHLCRKISWWEAANISDQDISYIILQPKQPCQK